MRYHLLDAIGIVSQPEVDVICWVRYDGIMDNLFSNFISRLFTVFRFLLLFLVLSPLGGLVVGDRRGPILPRLKTNHAV